MELVVILLFIAVLLEAVLTSILSNKVKNLENNQEKEEIKTIKRKHATIQNTNYNSVLTARGEKKAYEVFKNENGLYEPVKPQGIGIKIEKED